MKIKTYEYQKVAIEETEIFIPEEIFYCFQPGIRRSIRIIPQRTNWESPNIKKGDIYELEVTCVYQSFECILEKFNVRLSMIEDYINRNEKSKEAQIAQMLLSEDYFLRTKEQFESDYQMVLKEFK